MKKDDFKRHAETRGGGGYRCPCCGPRGGDEKRSWRRQARKRLRRADLRDLGEQLAELEDDKRWDELCRYDTEFDLEELEAWTWFEIPAEVSRG